MKYNKKNITSEAEKEREREIEREREKYPWRINREHPLLGGKWGISKTYCTLKKEKRKRKPGKQKKEKVGEKEREREKGKSQKVNEKGAIGKRVV